MEGISAFLQSSTIHGVSYISTTTTKYIRLFWITVVTASFIGAGFMIYQSFKDWHRNPVKTTIETLPIADITFPTVTVCPPKNTFTNLNYDLMRNENMTIKKDTRDELTNIAMELLYEHLYDTIINNLRKIVDDGKYKNWYHGYTKILIPYMSKGNRINYQLRSSALSGNISTQYFGDEFNAENVEKFIDYQINVYPPYSMRNNPNVTLHFHIEKVSMKDISIGYDKLTVKRGEITGDIMQMSINYTKLGSSESIIVQRQVTSDDVV